MKKNQCFISPVVLCPYYQYESRNSISCADEDWTPRLHVTFPAGEKKAHKERYCKHRCEQCFVYRAICGG